MFCYVTINRCLLIKMLQYTPRDAIDLNEGVWKDFIERTAILNAWSLSASHDLGVASMG